MIVARVVADASGPPWALYAALISAGAGLLIYAGTRLKEARDRRRDEYSRAFAVAMLWTEFPYRIARRLSDDTEACEPIVAAMHNAQEEIAFHQSWLRSVSDEIADSYDSLVRSVKTKSEPHIHDAWRRPPATIPEGMILGDAFPVDVKTDVAAFITAIRRDLSLRRRICT